MLKTMIEEELGELLTKEMFIEMCKIVDADIKVNEIAFNQLTNETNVMDKLRTVHKILKEVN